MNEENTELVELMINRAQSLVYTYIQRQLEYHRRSNEEDYVETHSTSEEDEEMSPTAATTVAFLQGPSASTSG